MKPKKVNYSPGFVKSLAKFPKSQLRNLATKEEIFRENLFDPRLKTHKLKGRLEGFYSFSISYHWRIVFHFEGDEVFFDAAGTHSIYK
ncbi:MAG: type II toxin-antitoxin system mRNA interferase toxin, RelE/StbE family [Candidatus Blackburnbacteria bacterium]|nr:type II toxin-antitoxin system mRNA interferase toxin, RelE/StbE family [Candidatus Blackburnbacteria bacterium]